MHELNEIGRNTDTWIIIIIYVLRVTFCFSANMQTQMKYCDEQCEVWSTKHLHWNDVIGFYGIYEKSACRLSLVPVAFGIYALQEIEGILLQTMNHRFIFIVPLRMVNGEWEMMNRKFSYRISWLKKKKCLSYIH